jgi:uncharacterized cupredoxin-like copper-binding protein
VALAAALSGYSTAPSAGHERLVAPTVVTVTAGKPTEFAFKLSKSSAIPWNAASRSARVTVTVANSGTLAHAFKVCTVPLEGALTNSCTGKGTSTLRPGQAATLTITFTTRGTYEYLSSVAGQAARGMKGMIGIGVTLPKTTTPPVKTTTTPSTNPSTPSTPSPPSTPSSPSATGETAAGAAVWAAAGCSGCHSIGEVRGSVGPDLNARHPGPFDTGPLTAKQLADLIAYISSR